MSATNSEITTRPILHSRTVKTNFSRQNVADYFFFRNYKAVFLYVQLVLPFQHRFNSEISQCSVTLSSSLITFVSGSGHYRWISFYLGSILSFCVLVLKIPSYCHRLSGTQLYRNCYSKYKLKIKIDGACNVVHPVAVAVRSGELIFVSNISLL